MLDTLLSFLANGLTHASGWQVFAFTAIATHITICAVTIYLHRCQAHRALELHPIVSHFFRMWLWLSTGMVTKEWAAVHRKHHAKCETEEDPHSPQTRGLKKVFFEGAELYRVEARNAETVEKYGHGTPDDWIERNLYSKYTTLGISLMMVINIALFGFLGLTVWAVEMVWIPLTAAGIINGIGHFWGYRNYDCNDAATNLIPIGILIGGEEMHNNHHTFATSAKFSSKWYELDIGWVYIRILSAFRLAKVKKVAPAPKIGPTKHIPDLETLQAVVANRYDVMAQYAKSVRRAWSEEVSTLSQAKLGSSYLRTVRKLMQREPAKLEDAQRAELDRLFAHSTRLREMHKMRIELGTIWARSTASSEQLLAHLQDWCARAEASGIRSLQEFSKGLRRYC